MKLISSNISVLPSEMRRIHFHIIKVIFDTYGAIFMKLLQITVSYLKGLKGVYTIGWGIEVKIFIPLVTVDVPEMFVWTLTTIVVCC